MTAPEPARRSRCREAGQVTYLGLGLAVGLLVVGGFSIDLWRVLTVRRSLAEAADASAAAGANAIDLDRYRTTGELRLDPELAVAWAEETLAAQADLDALRDVSRLEADAEHVAIELEGEVELTLLRIFTLGEPVALAVSAEAVPVRGP